MAFELLRSVVQRLGVWLLAALPADAFWRRPAPVAALAAGLLVNIGTWVGLFFSLPTSPFPFTLHYTAALGADFFGRRADLFTIPAIGLFLLALNAFVAVWLWERERMFAALVLGFTPFVQIGLAAGSVFLILANV
ncbi:hypothetical protein HYW67_03095 [Candidatus Parcubacteria bacterium]|nr:hypothetical protein [Candidatus Parcubacteria bacterium]